MSYLRPVATNETAPGFGHTFHTRAVFDGEISKNDIDDQLRHVRERGALFDVASVVIDDINECVIVNAP